MSWIGNNLLNSPFAGFPPQPPETPVAQYASPPAPPFQSDSMIVGFPSPGAGALNGAPNGMAGSNGLGAMMAGFATYVNNLFNQIASWYGTGTASGSPAQSGTYGPGSSGQNAGCQGNPAQCEPPAGSQNEAFFSNASASSWGDPHDTFNGNSANGRNVNSSWDNMRSHADLLDSNSFAGGYRVSTQVTQPNAQGVTMNQSASVATNNGNTIVSLNASGQYQISSYGNNVTLQSGQTAQLGGGESVTLNADGSLTVTDSSTSGGQISTTLKTNGNGGVDVSAQANRVDLGGYLVSHEDERRTQPTGPGVGPQPRPQVWRVEPDAAASPPVTPPSDQIEQLAN
jgi:hypothetical protein